MNTEVKQANETVEIDQLRLVEGELRVRVRQQAALAELSHRALVSQSLEEFFNEAIFLVAKTLSIEFCKILELMPGGEELLLIAGIGWKEGLIGQARFSTDHTQAGYTLQSNVPVIVNDLPNDTRLSHPQLLIDHGVVSGITVIIPGRKMPFGVLGVHTPYKRSFTQDDTLFIQGVANILASAIERFRTEEDLRRSHDQLAVILQNVADGITVQDASGALVFANQAAARTIGYATVEELLDTPPASILNQFEMFSEDGSPFPWDQLPGRMIFQWEAEPQAVIRFKMKESGEEHWSFVKARPILGPDGSVEMAVNIFQDITAIKRDEQSQRFLARSSEILTSSLEYEETLQNLANLAIYNLADWCSVHIVDENGEIRQLAVAHRDPEKVEFVRKLRQRVKSNPEAQFGVTQVIQTGKSEFYPEITPDILNRAQLDEEQRAAVGELGLHSSFILPMIARGRTIGAISMVWAESAHKYTSYDVKLAEELTRQAAIAIDNAALYRQAQAANTQLENRVAQRTQQLQTVIAKLREEITERKKVEAALRENEAMLGSMFESAPDATILVGEDGLIERANAQTEAMFGFSRQELVGKPVDTLMPARFRKRHSAFRLEYQQEPRPRSMGLEITLYGCRKDGIEFPVDIMLSPLEKGDQRLTLASIRDITARKQMEAELAEVQRSLIDSLEAERLHLAQELHDSAIQDLYALNFQLNSLAETIAENPSGTVNLNQPKETVIQVISLLRSICGELRPPNLAPFGLEKAIRAHVQSLWDANPELKVYLELDEDRQRLPEPMRLALYRIYQHAISNVLRHSNARQVWLRLKLDENQLLLEIKDDGDGFKLPRRWVELARQGHLGLVGTAERAEAIGGELKVETKPGQGTTIQVVVPLTGGPGMEDGSRGTASG